MENCFKNMYKNTGNIFSESSVPSPLLKTKKRDPRDANLQGKSRSAEEEEEKERIEADLQFEHSEEDDWEDEEVVQGADSDEDQLGEGGDDDWEDCDDSDGEG